MRNCQHQTFLDGVVGQRDHPTPPFQKPERLQEPAELFFQEIAKTLPQERKLFDPFCIRLSQTLKIGLLRNQLNGTGQRRSVAPPRVLTCCRTGPPGSPEPESMDRR
jgi:hypothetical protein